jgi:predicted alpha/beta superfamily hydrolase
MKRLVIVLLVLTVVSLALYAGVQVRRWRRAEEEKRLREIHTLTGNVTSYPDFRSRILGGKRRIWVCLPPSYDSDPERRFPVLYLQDGQNVFDGATAFLAGHEWEADETAERLIEQGRIEPLIIVAVDNAGARRVDEYTPAPDARDHGGGADLYGRMLVEELKPWVDQTWRTRADREDTGIGGSSLGALVSLWVGFSHPEIFGKIAALSPSVWWDDGYILRFVAALPEKPDTRIWVDIGTEEGGRSLEDARRLRDALLARGWREGGDLRYVEAEGARHGETAWARRLPEVLQFLYPPGPPASAAPGPVPGSPPGGPAAR